VAQQYFLQSLLVDIGLAISRFQSVNTTEKAIVFFRQLGYEFSSVTFGTALQNLTAKSGELVKALEQLSQASDESSITSALINILRRISTTVDAISQFHLQLQMGGGAGIPNIADFPRRLTDFLILDYFSRQKPQLYEIFYVLGLIEYEQNPTLSQPMRLIHWGRFGQFLTEPSSIVDDVYHWNSDFEIVKFLGRIEGMMRSAGLPGGFYQPSDATNTALGKVIPDLGELPSFPPADSSIPEIFDETTIELKELRFPIFQKGLTPETYSQFGITLSPAKAVRGKKKGIALLPYLIGTSKFNFAVCDKGELVFESNVDLKGIGLVIRPPFNAEGILGATGNFRTAIQIREKAASADEIILIGSQGGTRLSVQGLGITWFVQNLQGKPDLGFEASLKALRLVIAPGEGDGFLSKILSGLNVQGEASLALGITLLSGVTLQGGAKLAIEVHTHIELGPVEIQALRIALSPTTDRLHLEAGANFKFNLGPLKAIAENIGIQSDLRFRQGNLGPAQLDVAFKPPNGVGLSIDAGAVKGGGYLKFDFDRGEYSGAIELVFSGFLNLKAIGLITTKMPDGSPGFSLLIIITAEFATGLQLGFGFTLLAVGGLIGLNCTMRLEPLAEGVRTGAINNILFPKDVIANAPRIISDLRTIFPPEEGKFLIGPMAKLGWGTPTLVSLSLGIIIEIPGDIAILGVLKVALPTVDAPLLVLQVNFIGKIEFDKKRIWFFASLFESRLLFMTLEGEMGLLVAFGDDANFVVSVGGFHPQFNPPPLPFPSPKRIAINYINEPNARIRVMNYFAVTSNTAQLGAHAELFFGLSEVSVEGHMGFDALIQFSPFNFIVEVSASVALKAFGVGVFSISLRFALSGPNPWRARGTGSISLLFIKISADFDITWGEERNTTLKPIEALPLLQTEFGKLDNWRAILPASNNLLVSLRKLEPAADTLVLHPVGVLRISQKAIPLDLSIDKIGNQKTSDAKKLSVTVADAKPGEIVLNKTKDAQEQFAIAQFQNMEDASKLSRPAYEPQHGGLELSVKDQQLKSSRMVKRVIRYEEIIIDNNFKRFVRNFSIFVGALFNHFMAGASISKSSLSQSYQEKLQPFAEKIAVQPANYVVAFQATNTAFKTTDKSVTTVGFTSQASANDYMQQQIALDPNMSDALHVIPTHEVVTV
jgi:hypothetical protein